MTKEELGTHMKAMENYLDDVAVADKSKLNLLDWLWDNHRNYLLAKPPFNKKFLKELNIWIQLIKIRK